MHPRSIASILALTCALALAAATAVPAQAATPTGVSCPSASLCVVAAGPQVYTSTHPRGGANAWRRTDLAAGQTASAVSCASSTACVAVGDGSVLVSTDPTGGSASWRTVATFEFIHSLASVACPSTSVCIAGSLHGELLTGLDPFGPGGSWSSEQFSKNVFQVACPSTALCGANTYGTLDFTTDPAGGPGTWFAVGTPSFSLGIACASTTLCITAGPDGEVIAVADPAAAATTTVTQLGASGMPLFPLACAGPSLCLAFDGSRVFSSTDPAGGAGAWSAAELPPAGATEAASCPSPHLCVAVTDAGNALVSTHPTGGDHAWRASSLDGGAPGSLRRAQRT